MSFYKAITKNKQLLSYEYIGSDIEDVTLNVEYAEFLFLDKLTSLSNSGWAVVSGDTEKELKTIIVNIKHKEFFKKRYDSRREQRTVFKIQKHLLRQEQRENILNELLGEI